MVGKAMPRSSKAIIAAIYYSIKTITGAIKRYKAVGGGGTGQ
jgi:hypothetical protein